MTVPNIYSICNLLGSEMPHQSSPTNLVKEGVALYERDMSSLRRRRDEMVASSVRTQSSAKSDLPTVLPLKSFCQSVDYPVLRRIDRLRCEVTRDDDSEKV